MAKTVESSSEVVIVSVFGRGHWMAAELVGRGLSVSVVELSDQMGRWSPEDVEGPFGYFHASNFTLSQKARLDEEDYSELVDDGFVLWLKNGPIDMRGPHSAHVLEKVGVTNDMFDYIGNFDSLSPRRRESLIKGWKQQAFAQSWFVNLAHSLASPFSSTNREALNYGRPLPLTSPYAVRRVSRRGFEKSLQWVEALGAKVHSKSNLQKLNMTGRELSGLVMAGNQNLYGEQFIWCLTSSETKRVSANVFGELFPHGELESEWVWVRYRISLSKSMVTEALPLKFLVLEEVGLPWSHSNLIWMQRTTSPEIFDGWVRVPTVHRFQKTYLEAMGREMISVLTPRLPGVEIRIAEPPQEFTYEPSELGPALHPIFNPAAVQKFSRRSFRNLQFDGPETWNALDWSARMESQKTLVQTIDEWKKARQIAAAKKAAAEARAQARGGHP